MTTLNNEIVINAPIASIWRELSQMERLAYYDPTVKDAHLLTESNHGLGARRKVRMLDGKNWFEETCTAYREEEELQYDLDACSFPVHRLNHRYHFERLGDGRTKVVQVMTYQMKFGPLGSLMGIALKPQWNRGISLFLQGLKQIAEEGNGAK